MKLYKTSWMPSILEENSKSLRDCNVNPLKDFKTFVQHHVSCSMMQLCSGSYFNISNPNRFMETEEVPGEQYSPKNL